MSRTQTFGFLSFTLHAHLPYVVNHGTWPHGLEWLLEAAADTYLPLLRLLRNLHRDGIALKCNLNLSPILLEQLAHPVFRSEFPKYLDRKIASAQEDEAVFRGTGEPHFAETARFWQDFFSEAQRDFAECGENLIREFRQLQELGCLEIITCAATHGYLPLLGTDESVRAQIGIGAVSHRRHFGTSARGIWLPECGYRPAGMWAYPVTDAEGREIAPPFQRAGTEQILEENDLEYFFADTHLIEESARSVSPYTRGGRGAMKESSGSPRSKARRLYQPYRVVGESATGKPPRTVFARDPRTGLQVWSGETGYPGDANYLDFHKKRWPGGHRYWRVTGPDSGMESKQPYDLDAAAERVRSHAAHFVSLVCDALRTEAGGDAPPVLSATFDAELFGHWWFEGPLWLEAVARILHDHPSGPELSTASQYLERYPASESVSMPEGSWGPAATTAFG